jgi:hypothetical protein
VLGNYPIGHYFAEFIAGAVAESLGLLAIDSVLQSDFIAAKSDAGANATDDALPFRRR